MLLFVIFFELIVVLILFEDLDIFRLLLHTFATLVCIRNTYHGPKVCKHRLVVLLKELEKKIT